MTPIGLIVFAALGGLAFVLRNYVIIKFELYGDMMMQILVGVGAFMVCSFVGHLLLGPIAGPMDSLAGILLGYFLLGQYLWDMLQK
ncbi:MAG: hypothetical protein VX730_08435 [Pseudomonadota bacterium]|nr:hypothetical protein [Pseudomonadota bacterium]